MKKKVDQLRDLMLSEQWDKALSLAAKFADLGEFKGDIVRAHEAVVNPSFYKQMGKCPEQLRRAGITALMLRYKRFYKELANA